MSGFDWLPGEEEMWVALHELSDPADFNLAHSRALLRDITATGKPIDELTVGELRKLIREVQP
ncbi:hypothetical protein ABWU93_11625 [Xanthomonas translucens pv. translucens]|uniref:hypothetical protein n=1 Tax=Xanthomonas campestris pv. translucens TaxID=343 RepID=UPI003F6F2CAD